MTINKYVTHKKKVFFIRKFVRKKSDYINNINDKLINY